jgi:hypothetical protein
MEETEVIDFAALIEACRKEYCQYIVISPTRKTSGDAEELGLTLAGEVDGYLVYLDPVSQEAAESFARYYEEDES